MKAPESIKRLVARFSEHVDEYKSDKYKEQQVCAEFILPMFEAMGWDVANREGYSEAYKEVIHHDSIKTGVGTKAPDYCFRVGGVRKFFLEAKKPSISIKDEPNPAFQLRRYAWSAKLPLGIVTDFEEFAVYDCRIKPVKSDKASTARILYLNYDQYLDQWHEIAGVFSKDAILKGSFDKFVEGAKGKRGTTSVDVAFLEEIERWRQSLAQGIAQSNKRLDTRELNFAVQVIIDRIIFLRICEDKGFEGYGQLMALENGPHVYSRLMEIFRHADRRYNSGLFHFEEEKGRATPPDALTPRLKVADDVLRDTVRNLYYPQSPYEFSVIPTEILGQAYERFLGRVIHLTPTRRVKIEEKPEVRKAGGVYYTPSYIVDYIVQNTVGKLLEGKSPKEAAKLRILDPACGSGSFLIGAYDLLRNWHLDWYVKHDPEKWSKGRAPALYKIGKNEWALTFTEQRRILTDNLYGVDIDPQATEVTKLSLLLKLLEGLTQQEMFREHALPDLGSNIKCGNSLIEPKYYDKGQMGLFSEEERELINAFDWKHEFTPIMQRGGFDAVIGNPPYGMITDAHQKAYFENTFKTTEGRFDNFELFIEQGTTLIRPQGKLGYIIPNTLLSNLYARRLRHYLASAFAIDEITNFGLNVFADPTVHTCILILSRGKKENQIRVRKQVNEASQLQAAFDYKIPQSNFLSTPNNTFDIFIDPLTDGILNKIQEGSDKFGDIYFIRQCIKTGNDDNYVSTYAKPPRKPWKPSLRGRSIERYVTLETNLYVKYGNWLARNWKNTSFYETPKIAVRETGSRIIATMDDDNRYFLSSLYALYPKDASAPDLSYVLAILNSKLATHFIKAVALNLTKGAFTKFRTNQLARLPIKRIDNPDKVSRGLQSAIIQNAQKMILLNSKLKSCNVPQEQINIKRQIDATDRQIDQLVYELYGLTKEEIKIVEEA